MKLEIIPQNLSICRLSNADSIPEWSLRSAFFSITKTYDELSVVCTSDSVPMNVKKEKDWRAIKVQGPLDFALTGILSQLANPLADAGISIFAISTYDTDYVLVREQDLARAIQVLNTCGHEIVESKKN